MNEKSFPYMAKALWNNFCSFNRQMSLPIREGFHYLDLKVVKQTQYK